jgi:uncharacterized tellurite resistance protein B-like protein
MRNHLRQEIHGIEADASQDDHLRIAKAVILIASGDGELSKIEWEYMVGLAKAYGTSDETIKQLEKFDWKVSKLEDVLTPSLKPLGRSMLYDAIRIASSDGYHEGEKAAARKAAKLIGIDEHTVKQIEGMIEAEAGLREARIALLNPR